MINILLRILYQHMEMLFVFLGFVWQIHWSPVVYHNKGQVLQTFDDFFVVCMNKRAVSLSVSLNTLTTMLRYCNRLSKGIWILRCNTNYRRTIRTLTLLWEQYFIWSTSYTLFIFVTGPILSQNSINFWPCNENMCPLGGTFKFQQYSDCGLLISIRIRD